MAADRRRDRDDLPQVGQRTISREGHDVTELADAELLLDVKPEPGGSIPRRSVEGVSTTS
jgi:hypothetical protein